MPRSKEVNVKLLDEEFFKQYGLPKYATEESAGMDLRACIPDSIIIEPQSRVLIPTGLCIDINDSNLAWVLIPKSGLGHKKGFVLGNLVGLIDSDYQQEEGGDDVKSARPLCPGLTAGSIVTGKQIGRASCRERVYVLV